MKWIVEGFDVVLLKKIGAVLIREGIHWEIASESSNTRPCKAIFVPNEEFHRAVQIVQQLPDDFPTRPLDI